MMPYCFTRSIRVPVAVAGAVRLVNEYVLDGVNLIGLFCVGVILFELYL